MAVGVLRAEFHLRNLGLNYPGTHDAFYSSQWRGRRCRVVFVLYRLFTAGYVLGWNIYGYVTLPAVGRHYSAVYLTQWAYVLLSLYLIVAFLVLLYYTARPKRKTALSCESANAERANEQPDQTYEHVAQSESSEEQLQRANEQTEQAYEQKENSYIGAVSNRVPEVEIKSTSTQAHPHDEAGNILANLNSGVISQCNSLANTDSTLVDSEAPLATVQIPLPHHLRFVWLLYAVILGVVPLVSMVYFFFLYPYIRSYNPNYSAGALDINLHGINSVILFLDVMVNQMPIRILHLIYPLILGLIYIIFSAIYWALDKENNTLYPHILDWNYPGVTIAVILAISLLFYPLLQLFWFGIYHLRLWISYKVYGTRYT